MQRNKIEEDIYVFRTNMEAVFITLEKQNNIYSQLISQGAEVSTDHKKERKKYIYYGGKLRILMTTMIEF